MFIASISSITAELDVKSSWSTLILIFLTEVENYITFTKYYNDINTKNHNKSNNVW